MPTIAAMTAEIRANNIAKGWRSAAGGPGDNTLGDYIALLHTEIAEATEAYRDHRLADVTSRVFVVKSDQPDAVTIPHPKPEGVGSELADYLIRLLDMGDVFGFRVFDPDLELADVAYLHPRDVDVNLPDMVTFGDYMAWLHRCADRLWTDNGDSLTIAAARALRAVVTVAHNYGIDLDAEYARKMDYNRSRSYRHGGRALSDTNA